MKIPSRFWDFSAAVTGFLLQSGVLVIASILTYHLQLKIEDKPPNAYGFPAMAAGTILLCTGNFLCAFLVGESTKERVFRRTPPTPIPTAPPPGTPSSEDQGPTTKLVWLQPGNQRIGDQTFDSFAYSGIHDPNEQYITSWKDASQKPGGVLVWLAIIFSITGFVAQFIGMRGLHPLVSIAQLGVMLIMSSIRSLLRTQRLSRDSYLLDGFSDVLKGHDLDWLAMSLELDNKGSGRGSFVEGLCARNQPVGERPTVKELPFWTGGRVLRNRGVLLQSYYGQLHHGVKSIGIFGYVAHRDWDDAAERSDDLYFLIMPKPLSASSKILGYRTRLARLTNPSRDSESSLELPAGLSDWFPNHISYRHEAEILVSAITRTAAKLMESPFGLEDSGLKYWDPESLTDFSWAASCWVYKDTEPKADEFFLSIQADLEGDRRLRKMDVSTVEAVLGLWIMAIELDPKSKRYHHDLATDSISRKPCQVVIGGIFSLSPYPEISG
jgi:hypothetical protein